MTLNMAMNFGYDTKSTVNRRNMENRTLSKLKILWYPMYYNNLLSKIIWKKNVTESLCCTPETNAIL